MIEATAFGALFLPALALLVVLRREWFPAAIPLSAVLQAPAPLVVSIDGARYGITPFNLVVAAAGLLLLLGYGRAPRVVLARLRGSLARPWAIYLCYAALAALLLPHLFGHVKVYPLLAYGDVQMSTASNTFSISHFAQAINHVGLLVLLAYLVAQPELPRVARAMAWGFALASVISLLAAGYQRVVFLGWHATDFSFWASNPSYNQWFHAPEYGPTFGRVGLPFIEPSYASVWFAGMVGGCWMLALYWRGRAVHAAALATGVALLGLLNTVGTSGLAAMAMFVPLLLARHLSLGPERSPRSNRVLALLLVVLLSAAGFALLDYVWLKTDIAAPLRSAIYFTLQKTSNLAERPRFITTLHALSVFVDSFAVGIGPGSTRTSGFLVSLLAHLGVPGLVLLGWAVWRTLGALEQERRDPWALFALGMVYAGGLGVLVGIADLAWPVAWAWILFAVVVAARPRQQVCSASRDILEGRASPFQAGSQPDRRAS